MINGIQSQNRLKAQGINFGGSFEKRLALIAQQNIVGGQLENVKTSQSCLRKKPWLFLSSVYREIHSAVGAQVKKLSGRYAELAVKINNQPSDTMENLLRLEQELVKTQEERVAAFREWSTLADCKLAEKAFNDGYNALEEVELKLSKVRAEITKYAY